MKTRLHKAQRSALILAIASLLSVSSPGLRFDSKPTKADGDLKTRLATCSAEEVARSLPMRFEANRGQADADVKFVGRGEGFGVLLKPGEAVLALNGKKPKASTQTEARSGSAGALPPAHISMKLEDANSTPFVSGVDQQVAQANYFIGNDSAKWVRGIDTYSGVLYTDVYNGVDLMFHSNQRQLEYDFMIAPQADPNQIRVRFDGADDLRLTSDGALILSTPAGELRHDRPIAYQTKNDTQVPVSAEFRQLRDGAITFTLGDYDRTLPLVIDPLLVYSSYMGGSASDFGRGIKVDLGGTMYVVGDSVSSDFLFRSSLTNSDVFVGRLSPDGLLLTYVFFGGEKNEFATGLAIDLSGNIYLSGNTESKDFPIVSSVGTELLGESDAFVVKLTANFQQFIYSSLIGGGGKESGVSLTIDSAGSAYISGRTSSQDFPLVGAMQPIYGGGDFDAFVSKLSADGKTLVYSTYLGGGDTEDLMDRSGIGIDSDGNVYVTGDTQSTDFPVKNAVQAAKNGAASTSDGFVSVINPSGSNFVYSTYMGGTNDDFGLAIATDQSHNAYIAGSTKSTSFPGSTSTRTSTTTSDAFVAKLNPTGSAITYLTFIGGAAGNEAANAIALDNDGTAVIVGSAGAGVPTLNSIQSFFKGGANDALIARLTASGAVSFSTYLGGGGDDVGLGVAIHADHVIYVTGVTDSQDLLTVASLRDTNAGARDIIIAKIDPNATPNNPVLLQAVISGKHLLIYGTGFDDGAVLRINDVPTKTRNENPDPSQVLFAKKAAKKIAPGQTVQLQVENPNGRRSNFLFFTKPL